jgi:hypothetical protein
MFTIIGSPQTWLRTSIETSLYMLYPHKATKCVLYLTTNPRALTFKLQDAVNYAKSAYPTYLGSVPDHNISFNVRVIVQGNPSKVTIAPNAWGAGKWRTQLTRATLISTTI